MQFDVRFPSAAQAFKVLLMATMSSSHATKLRRTLRRAESLRRSMSSAQPFLNQQYLHPHRFNWRLSLPLLSKFNSLRLPEEIMFISNMIRVHLPVLQNLSGSTTPPFSITYGAISAAQAFARKTKTKDRTCSK